MTRKRSFLLLLTIALLMLGAANTFAQIQPPGRARLRFAHLAIDLSSMDALEGEIILASGLTYGNVSGYISVNAGTRSLTLIPTGASSDFALAGPIDLEFEADHSYLIAVIGQRADSSFMSIVIDETAAFTVTTPDPAALEGKARVIVLNGLSDAPALDVIVAQGSSKAVENLPYGSFSALALDPGDYPLVVTPTGQPDTVVFNDLNPIRLEGDRLYLLAAAGSFPTDFRLVQDMTGTKTLVELISTTPELSQLYNALEASGLTESLRADGPFTVFAPINAAFEALSSEMLEALLANPAQLSPILLYHVVPRRVLTNELVTLPSVPTIAQSEIRIVANATQIILNDSVQIVTADLVATNGVVHIVDRILIP